MRVSGIKGGALRFSPLPQDMLYTFYWRYILSGGKGEQLLHAWYKLRSSDEYIYIKSACQSRTLAHSPHEQRSALNGRFRAQTFIP